MQPEHRFDTITHAGHAPSKRYGEVVGYLVLTSTRGQPPTGAPRWCDDWDGEVHTTLSAGRSALRDASEARCICILVEARRVPGSEVTADRCDAAPCDRVSDQSAGALWCAEHGYSHAPPRSELAEAFIRGVEYGAEFPDVASDGDAMYEAFRQWVALPPDAVQVIPNPAAPSPPCDGIGRSPYEAYKEAIALYISEDRDDPAHLSEPWKIAFNAGAEWANDG